MTAGLVSSQFCIYFSNTEPKKVTDDDSDVWSDQKRTWCSTRSRNPRRRARQVGYAVEIGHNDTYRLGLSINTRVICNVCWNTWVEGDVVKVVKSPNSLIFLTSTYFSLTFGLVWDDRERYWASEYSYPVTGECYVGIFRKMKEKREIDRPPPDIWIPPVFHLLHDSTILP